MNLYENPARNYMRIRTRAKRLELSASRCSQESHLVLPPQERESRPDNSSAKEKPEQTFSEG